MQWKHSKQVLLAIFISVVFVSVSPAPPAARITDFHQTPMQTPSQPVVPRAQFIHGHPLLLGQPQGRRLREVPLPAPLVHHQTVVEIIHPAH